MNHCKYCTYLQPERHADTIQWNPLIWTCVKKKEVDRIWEEVFAQPERDCPDFEREPGSDDDSNTESETCN